MMSCIFYSITHFCKTRKEVIQLKLPLPDFGKEIKVGDPSFVYKGIYNAIYWDGEDPYRPRVENLVVRNGKEVFLRLYDEVNDGFVYRYRVPGGSLDNDSTKIEQAENETNEEALLKVKNIASTGVAYFESFPEGYKLKKGDICLLYKGNITDVFVSEYAGKMDKSKIDPHDLDDDMATNGKFHYITQIAQLLRQEHVDALLNSPLVDDVTKTLMLRLRRGDIEAKKSYRNLYDEIVPDSKKYDSLLESTGGDKKIYLVISHYKSPFGDTVRAVTGGYYNHAGLSLDKKLDKMYTYSRRTSMNEGRVLGGFAVESFSDFKHGKTDDIDIKVIACDVTKDQFDYVKERMNFLSKNISKTHYNFFNLLTSAFKIPINDNLSSDLISICSVFVATVMKAIGHPVSGKPVNLVTPDDIASCDSMSGFRSVYIGGVDKFTTGESEHFYFYHMVPKGTKLDSKGITSLQYQYNNGQYDLATKNADKYRDRLCNGWNIYPDKNPEDLSMQEIIDGLNTFRKDKFGANRIYLFKYPPFKGLGSEMSKVLAGKDVYRIDLDDESVQKYIRDIDWGYNMSNSDNRPLNEDYYRSVTPDEYFSRYTEGGSDPLFATLNHIAIIPKDGYIPKSCWMKIQTPVSVVTEQNNVYELQPVSKDVKIYHGSPVQNIKEVKAFHNDRIYSELGPVIFTSSYPSFAACYGIRWDDTKMKQNMDWDNDTLTSVSIALTDPDIIKDWDKPCSLYELENHGNFKQLPNHPCEIISPNPAKVIKETKFNSFWDMAKKFGIKIISPDGNELMNVMTESTLCRNDRTKRLRRVQEMLNPVSEIGAFSTSTTGGDSTNLASLRKDKIDKHLIDTLSKQFKSLEHVRVDENCNGFIYFDKESSPVAIINVEELSNGKKVIQNLTVVASYKDSGLEEQLISVAARELGANFATVSKKNEDLIKAYKSNGFREVGESPISVSLQRGEIITEGYNDGFLGMYKKSLIGKKVYHGSLEKYEMLEPTGLDLGNKLEEPGWSLYTWLDRDKAYGWSIFAFIRSINSRFNYNFNVCAAGSHIPTITQSGFEAVLEYIRTADVSDRLFYVYDVEITPDMDIGLGHSSNTDRCVTIRTPHIKPSNIETCVLTEAMFRKYVKVKSDKEVDRIATTNANQRALTFLMDSDLMYQFIVNKDTIRKIKKAIKSGDLQPGESIQDFLDREGLKIEKTDFLTRLSMSVFDKQTVRKIKSVRDKFVSESTRSQLPDSEFGIPSQRKYELDTKKHVLSAIKLFNWVDEEHEKELAHNILKKIDEFHISDDEIHCTEKNRFYKYWKSGVTEAYIRNTDDIYYNKDKFDSGEINLCFITGHSGSGKSTMGYELMDDNKKLETYGLDDIIANWAYSDKNLEQYGDMIAKFFKGPGKKFRYHSKQEWLDDETWNNKDEYVDGYEISVITAFVKYAINYSKSHKDRKFVLEGVWVFHFIDPTDLEDYAVYIKGTSALISKYRASKRDTGDAETTIGKIRAFGQNMTQNWRNYFMDEKRIQKYRDYFSTRM